MFTYVIFCNACFIYFAISYSYCLCLAYNSFNKHFNLAKRKTIIPKQSATDVVEVLLSLNAPKYLLMESNHCEKFQCFNELCESVPLNCVAVMNVVVESELMLSENIFKTSNNWFSFLSPIYTSERDKKNFSQVMLNLV